MASENKQIYSVSDFIAIFNQTLEYAYPCVEIEGEVAAFKINQGKYVFFDLKDEAGTLNCFMSLFQLRQPIEDGMKVVISAMPKLTNRGHFSLTIRTIRPIGEGSLKKSFELLKQKLDKEGLFSSERKRQLPSSPHRIAVISSQQAAGYADFIRIIGERWGGMQVDVADVQVQGTGAADQIIKAIDYFNQSDKLPEVLVIIRGGGSADDLSVFNDEPLVRSIATSRVPVLTGIGHDIDISLVDLAADKSAATPSNAAEILVPDKYELIRHLDFRVKSQLPKIIRSIDGYQDMLDKMLMYAREKMSRRIEMEFDRLNNTKRLLSGFNPNKILERGYAIVRGEVVEGSKIEIETKQNIIVAEVRNVRRK